MQSNFQLDTLLHSAPIGVAAMDYEGIFKAVNPAYCAIYGYAADELIGQSVGTVFPVERRAEVLALHKRFLDQGGSLAGEWEVQRQDGRRLHVLSHSVHAQGPDGASLRVVYVTDISESKRNERALRDSEERLALVMRGTQDAYFDVDLLCLRRNYSARWLEIFGYTETELPLDGLHWHTITHAEDMDRLTSMVEQIHSGVLDRFEATLRMRHKQGYYLDILARGFISRDPFGKAVRVTGAITDLTQRLRIEAAARHFQSIVAYSDDAIVSKTTQGLVTSWNAGAVTMFGYSAEEMLGQDIRVLIPAEARSEEDFILQRINAGEHVDHFETVRVRKDGRLIHVSVTISPIRDAQGKILGASKIARDISHKKLLEARLQLTSSVFNNTHEGIAVVDARGMVVELNPALTSISGYRRGDLVGANVLQFLLPDEVQAAQQRIQHAMKESGHYQGEHWIARKDGQKVAVLLTVSSVPTHTGDGVQYVAMLADISGIRRRQEQLEHVARHDALTDLPNRSLFAERLQRAMGLARRQDMTVAVVFVDLDGFKAINDRHGHAAGDELLVLVAARLKESLREVDTLARIGGDEFAAVLVNVKGLEECEALAQRMLRACSEPAIAGGAVCVISASIGVTLFPGDGLEPEAMLAHADMAMYQAKLGGKNRVVFFHNT
jgi:diguanylate cyclase (GGDEF)-like protein/PAS domain S-box-containing protein